MKRRFISLGGKVFEAKVVSSIHIYDDAAVSQSPRLFSAYVHLRLNSKYTSQFTKLGHCCRVCIFTSVYR